MAKKIKNVEELIVPIPIPILGYDDDMTVMYYEACPLYPDYVPDGYTITEITKGKKRVLELHYDVDLQSLYECCIDQDMEPIPKVSLIDDITEIYTELIHLTSEKYPKKCLFLLVRDKNTDVPLARINLDVNIEGEDQEYDAHTNICISDYSEDYDISNFSNIRTLLNANLVEVAAQIISLNIASTLKDLPVKLCIGNRSFDVQYQVTIDDINDITDVMLYRLKNIDPDNYELPGYGKRTTIKDFDEDVDDFFDSIIEACNNSRYYKWRKKNI